jgi:hydrogenase expression/formation protein HypC
MCLSVPSQIVSIDEQAIAVVEALGVRREVSLALLDEAVQPGDYVLIHVGFAMHKIDQHDALASLALYREMIEQMESDAT